MSLGNLYVVEHTCTVGLPDIIDIIPTEICSKDFDFYIMKWLVFVQTMSF